MVEWVHLDFTKPLWRHQMNTFSALPVPVTGEFPSQRPVTRSFDVFFGLRLNKRLSKHSRRRWFETLLCPLWRHCNAISDCHGSRGEALNMIFKAIPVNDNAINLTKFLFNTFCGIQLISHQVWHTTWFAPKMTLVPWHFYSSLGHER